MAKRPQRPTLEAVAHGANVSKATASKVLNGRGGVSAATRDRVFQVMKELNYAPTTGRVFGGTTPTVTVLFDAYEGLYAVHVLAGVVAAGLEFGVDVVATNPTGRHAHQPLSVEWLRQVADKGHLGVIVVTTEVTAEAVTGAEDVGLALVAIDPVSARDADDVGLVSVSATNWTGGRQATDHLLGLGHRRIGFAGGRMASRPARDRYYGYVAALGAAGVDLDSALIRQRGFGHDDGRVMAEELLDLPEPPTAIVAGCDTSALGVMAAARRRNLRLPQDLSIVGFDDTYAAESAAPGLTTIHQPLREMGRLAVRTVMSLAEHAGPETHHFELATSLVMRQSTAPPPARAHGT